MSRSLVLCGAALLAGCGGPAADPGQADNPVMPTNRIPIPAAVVQNLGITLSPAKRGKLERTLSVPGHLVVPEDRRWLVRAPAGGRLRLRVARWDTVQAGQAIAELTSPELRSAQDQCNAARSASLQAAIAFRRFEAGIAPRRAIAVAKRAAARSARGRVAATKRLLERAQTLESACAARVESVRKLAAQSTVAAKQLHDAERERFDAAQLALDTEKAYAEAQVAAEEAELTAVAAEADAATLDDQLKTEAGNRQGAEWAYRAQLESLSALTGIAVEQLLAETDDGPAWANLTRLEIRAQAAGTVTQLDAAAGSWLEAGDAVCTILDPAELVFRGRCPEGDLARIPERAKVHIHTSAHAGAPLTSALAWPPRVADPVARTVLLEARVANPGGLLPDGVGATARVVLAASDMDEILIPRACVVRDGLESIVFRVDPKNPQQVIRTPVSLGKSNRDWVEVFSGVRPGDQLVRDGIHQLRRSGAGKAGTEEGHFHADGTWHAGPDH